MKVRSYCKECLKDLARKTVDLSGGDAAVLSSSLLLVDRLFDPHQTPTAISNELLRHIRRETGANDPFKEAKRGEIQRALEGWSKVGHLFPFTLEGVLRASAFGNGGDFFVDHRYETGTFSFSGDVDKIGRQVYLSSKILILGDNPGDFVFDRPLVSFLVAGGKKVFYGIKERPVQNDMSMADVVPFSADPIFRSVFSTGTDEVGIRKEEMAGVVKECWEDGSLVIAKGMGNFESLSAFHHERPVTYIMKVKCRSVAEALGREEGEYLAITAGGDHG